ncbi:hypothetical protein D3C81_1660920 [compost metagenome]
MRFYGLWAGGADGSGAGGAGEEHGGDSRGNPVPCASYGAYFYGGQSGVSVPGRPGQQNRSLYRRTAEHQAGA